MVDGPDRRRLLADQGGVRLDLADAAVDAREAVAFAARPIEEAPLAECAAVLALMAGSFLEDCELPDQSEYAAWLAAQRHDLQSIAVRIAHLRRLVALDPLDESAAAALARAPVECGHRNAAHRAVARAERNLRRAGLALGPGRQQPGAAARRRAARGGDPAAAQPQRR